MQRRHSNGGGRVIGDQAVVSPSAFVSGESSVFHGAHVTGSTRLEGKTGVGGTAVVHNSVVADSTIGKVLPVVLPVDKTYSVDGQPFQPTFPFVANAHIRAYSRIENQLILGNPRNIAMLFNCWLEDACEVRDSASLAYVHMTHYACVCESALVEGTAELSITLDARMHIHRGHWIIAPKYFEVGGVDDGEGIHIGITECEKGRVNVGCFCFKRTQLERVFARGASHRLARMVGWKDYHLEQLREGLEAWEAITN